jgi:hypothetical protein
MPGGSFGTFFPDWAFCTVSNAAATASGRRGGAPVLTAFGDCDVMRFGSSPRCTNAALERIPVRLKHPTPNARVVAGLVPGHPDYFCSVPQNSRSPGQAGDDANTQFNAIEIRASRLIQSN